MEQLVNLKGIINPIDELNSKGLMTTQIKVKDLLQIYHIDANINRDINKPRIPKIVSYINKFDSEPGIFLPAIMCAYSGDPVRDFNPKTNILAIPMNERLTVIDGQHRIRALESYLQSYHFDDIRKNSILESDLTLQLFFGLSEQNMRDLFVDINSNAVKVSMSLITAYDNREVLNVLVKDLYEISNSLQTAGIEFNKSKIMRPHNMKFSTSMRLKKFISILLFNKKILNSKEEGGVKRQYDHILSFLERFFYYFFDILPERPGDVLQYVLGHEAVQNAIAHYLNKNLIYFENDTLHWVMDWEERLEDLANINWSIKNINWSDCLIRARTETIAEFLTIDIKDEKKVLDKIYEEIN